MAGSAEPGDLPPDRQGRPLTAAQLLGMLHGRSLQSRPSRSDTAKHTGGMVVILGWSCHSLHLHPAEESGGVMSLLDIFS